ncbi:hypothetical protein [Actinoplanes sp. N902-109]|uniref:hypothetical protein n=1 Tax=Actinoplanes sp. (strain N902-109) TaxID=649831 RepID=UPI0012F915DA|nr:hypothetical protein [Actinoplanes sp. N902-109]
MRTSASPPALEVLPRDLVAARLVALDLLSVAHQGPQRPQCTSTIPVAAGARLSG